LSSRKISVFGLGYVGSVTAACLAHLGNEVTGFDIDHARVDALAHGHACVSEPQVEEFLARALERGLLRATGDVTAAVLNSEASFICVGTPALDSGELSLGQLETVCRQIGDALRQKTGYHIVVIRSTLLPGTTESTIIPLLEKQSNKRNQVDFAVCVNPEFTRQGSAVRDFMEPALCVLGCDGGNIAAIREVYSWVGEGLFQTDFRTAEMIKCMSNAWHAAKIVFANEVGTIAAMQSIDLEALLKIFCFDHKLNISPAYLNPGFAFGGSCLPKDVKALYHSGARQGLVLPLLASILPSNEEHLQRAAEKVAELKAKRIGLLGLTIKPTTDDFRSSPQVKLAMKLLSRGCAIAIYDQHLVRKNGCPVPNELQPTLRSSVKEVLAESDLILPFGLQMMHEVSQLATPDHTILDLAKLDKIFALDRFCSSQPNLAGVPL
jgi:GDP-mannose 6-dehydrogenase